MYQQFTKVVQVPPHLFAASDGAYAQMMNNTKDQSMLVSFAFKNNHFCFLIQILSRSPVSLGREKRRTRKRSSLTSPSSEPRRARRRKTESLQRRRRPTWRTGSSTRTQSSSLMAMPRLSGTTIPQDSENSSECELLYLPNLSTFHFSSFIATSTTWESWLVVTSTFTSWKSKLCLYLSPDHENLTRPPLGLV